LYELSKKYFPLYFPFYNKIHPNEVKPFQTSKPLGANAEATDCSNLKTLLTVAVRLRDLLRQQLIGEKAICLQDIEELGVTAKREQGIIDPYTLLGHDGLVITLEIELESGGEAREFLEAGIGQLRERNYTKASTDCVVSPECDARFSLSIRLSHFKVVPEDLSIACKPLLDSLSSIMLHDVSTETRNGGEPFQRPASIASSLWYTMGEMFRNGRAACCETCGKPFIAVSERRNKRLYCSRKCNKMHQRLTHYLKYVQEGHSEFDAAKKAKVSLERARAFWNERTNTSIQ
jgi:hypothetical protein